MGECTRDCWQCDICGFCWLKTGRTPDRCGSQKCRSSLWNRTRKSVVGRPDKGMVKVKQRMSPTLDSEGNHHALCPCILCLTAVYRAPKPSLSRGTPGRRKGLWKVTEHPRDEYEAQLVQEALIRGAGG